MKKIPTIFRRDPEHMHEVLDEPSPGCEWVFRGEGVATRKYDGTACMIADGELFKRREVKAGKPTPQDFMEEDCDEQTGKRVGWVPVNLDSKEDRWHAEAFNLDLPNGTYELLGPKVQGNPEWFEQHTLLRHLDAEQIPSAPRTFTRLRNFLGVLNIEGLVFHHPDGRMAKIKKRDFGLRRT